MFVGFFLSPPSVSVHGLLDSKITVGCLLVEDFRDGCTHLARIGSLYSIQLITIMATDASYFVI